MLIGACDPNWAPQDQLGKERVEDEFETPASLSSKRGAPGYRSIKVIPVDWLKAHGAAADKAGAIKKWQDDMRGVLRTEVARRYNTWKAEQAAEKETADGAGWKDEGPYCLLNIVSGWRRRARACAHSTVQIPRALACRVLGCSQPLN